MKFLIVFFSFILIMLQVRSQNSNDPRRITPEELVALDYSQRVFYEIFVRSFYDSNGDGMGDLNGITMKLDYLADLGIGGIWLTPFSPSPSYHKYDVVNYYGVDPQYGSLDDFKKLVKEAHKRNIHVLMDLVVNHTSHRHPWFRAAVNNDPQHLDFYLWKSDTSSSTPNWYLPRDAKGQAIPGKKYFGFFSWAMPDLNYDNQVVRDTIIKVGKWWLKETGVDGFRLDAAQHIYDAVDTSENNGWWLEFTNALKKEKPDVITIGEVWNKKEYVSTYLKSLSGCFNFEFSWDILKTLKQEKNDSLIEKLIETRNIYSKYSAGYIDPIFLSNHDGDRIMSLLNNNAEKAKLAASIYLTLPGTPFLYYGEELGMLGAKPDSLIREPFLWNNDGLDKGQTRWEKAFFSTPEKVKPVTVQLNDPSSMYQLYKKLISLRKKYLPLTSKELYPVNATSDSLLVYIRGKEDRMLVIHNLSGSPKVFSLTKDLSEFKRLVFISDEKEKIMKQSIMLPPYCSVIISEK